MKKKEDGRIKFSNWIKMQRLSHKQVAENIGIQRTALNKLLNGQFIPSLRTAVLIEKVTKGFVKTHDWIDYSDITCDILYVEENPEKKTGGEINQD